jgi:hypothetical protein
MTAPERADDVADFYRGKRISPVIGYGTGGGYHLYARMLGRFLGDHIPGKPTIIAQNMPGAGSSGAANWLESLPYTSDGREFNGLAAVPSGLSSAPYCAQWMIFSLVGQCFGDQHERVGTTQFVLDRLSDLHDLRR